MKELKETSLEAVIAQSVDRLVHKIVEEEAKKAGEEVEKRVRALTCQIAGNVSSWMEYERMGQNLVITIKFPKGEKLT